MTVKFEDMANLSYLEWFAERNPAMRGTVAAAVKQVAISVILETNGTLADSKRQQTSLAILTGDGVDHFINLFLAWVIQDPVLRGQFFDTAGVGSPNELDTPLEDRFKPWRMDSETLLNRIEIAWDVASGVHPDEYNRDADGQPIEPEGSEGE